MGARAMFDAAKHPRGAHGQFGSASRSYSVRNVGRKGLSRVEQQDVARTGKGFFPGHNLGSATTLHYAPLKSGRKHSIAKFGPALHVNPKTGAYTEVVNKYRYGKGASFHPDGWRPKPARSKMSGR